MTFDRRRRGPAIALVAVAALAGCGGGAQETAVKTSADAAKTDAPKTPAGGEAEVTQKVEAKPAAPKGKFARPNVEIETGSGGEPILFAGKELKAEACLLDTSAPDMKHEGFNEAIRSIAMGTDGAIYVLDHEKKARRYRVEPGDGCKLSLDTAFGKGGVLAFPEEPDSITVLDIHFG